MITEHSVGGWRAITVTSDHLSLTVLPDRGAEVHALVDRAERRRRAVPRAVGPRAAGRAAA